MEKTIVGFVDDTKQFNNIFGKHNDIIQNLKIDAQLWSNLLQLSGGAVNLGKCEYLVMTHKQMDNGTIRIYDASANPLIIQEGETNNEMTMILCTTPQKYVGIVTSTNGDHRHPLKYLRSICHNFIQQLQKVILIGKMQI